MPIPTDTFWNIKKLNWVFAGSAVALLAVTIWTILQDYSGGWRQDQQHARVWEAALVKEKLERDLTPEKRKELADLEAQIEQAQKDLNQRNAEYKKLTEAIRAKESDRDTKDFTLKTDKANIGVEQTHLQDAITAGDSKEVERLRRWLATHEKEFADHTEELFALNTQIVEDRKRLKEQSAALDALRKNKAKLEADADLARKKLEQLQPQSALAKLSEKIRATPLMGFINPPDKVQQVVLPDVQTDVAFMKITTVDRCTTCHTNIAKKEFTETNVLAYLEEQTATTRKLILPEKFSGVPTDPTATIARPGPVAMTDFWHAWARKLTPDAFRKSVAKLKAVTNTVGKSAKVSYNGAALYAFTFDPLLDDPKIRAAASTQPAATTQPFLADPEAQKAILLTLLDAWLKYDPAKPTQPIVVTSADGKVKVEISGVDDKAAKPIRNAIMRYAPELAAGLKSARGKAELKLLNDRYRFAMVQIVNVERKQRGLAALDPSPVNLAHPQLDLYCDADSKHPIESGEGKVGMGCTVCHDGSGQETDFVLAAHTPEDIWVDQKTGEPILASQLARPAEESHPFDLSSMLEAVYPENSVIPSLVGSLAIENPNKDEHVSSEAAHHSGHEDPPPVEYADPVTGRKGKAVTQFAYWKQTYEPTAPRNFHLVYDEWDWPMRRPEYLQVNCVRCHTDAYDIKEAAPLVIEGRYLFTNLGCANCHQMDSIPAEQNRKVGTDLRHVTSKLSPAYINTWIWAPKAFRPSTKMPHFFMLENSSSDEELRRTRQEARCITEYLTRTAEPLPPKYLAPEGLKGSPEAGKLVFNSIGCQGCHANLNDPQPEKRGGKNITLGEKWIVNDLVKAGKLKAEMSEKNGGKEPTAQQLTAEAQKQYDGMTYNERQLYVLENLEQLPGASERPVYPDNSPKPIFLHHGPELSGVGTKLTAGGRTSDQARAWLFDWLKEPRHYSDYTVMPRLRLGDQQALDLAEYLLSMKRTNDKTDDSWSADLTPVDTQKQIDMTALQLNNKYPIKVALAKADEEKELTSLATDAMTTPLTPPDKAREIVSSMDKDEKRMVFLGKKLIAHYGCMSCHAINGLETVSSPCANLSDWGQKQVSKLDYGYLSEHQQQVRELPPTTQIPMVNGLCAKVTKIAQGELKEIRLIPPEFVWGPERKPIAEPVTVAWPEIEMRREAWITQKLKNTRIFDRGKALLEPGPDTIGRPYDKLRMPTFYLNDEQVHAIVTFVLTARDALVSDKLRLKALSDQATKIARGRELTLRYNCVSCHIVEGNVPQVQQYYKPDEITVTAPPSLRGEGNKIQHEWLFTFFKDVQQLRPKLFSGIRMPTFPATDDDWTAIIAYFNAASKKESKDLKAHLAPVEKYIDDQTKLALLPIEMPTTQPTTKSATTKPSTQPAINPAVARAKYDQLIAQAGALISRQRFDEAAQAIDVAIALATVEELQDDQHKPLADAIKGAPADLKAGKVPDNIPWPGDDWYARPEFALSTEKLRQWALANRQLTEFQVDPARNKAEDLAKNYRLLRSKAEFVAELFDAPYPFVENGLADSAAMTKEQAEAHFKHGEQFFYDLQCLKCHVLGDPDKPGANKNPTAPNLSLTHERLQRRWVRHWVQEPDIIQKDTAMPPFFTGLPIFAAVTPDRTAPLGQSQPRAQTMSPADVQEREAKYGKTAKEQTDLLLDFLYVAGERGYTGMQPETATAPTTAPTTRPATSTKK